MVTRANITEFFDKYNNNLEREEMLDEMLYKTTDQEEWMERLRTKSRELRRMYVENEAMLNLYLRPFVRKEKRLGPETADEFLKQLSAQSEKGNADRLVCLQMGTVLFHYYEEMGDRDALIRIAHRLGNFYSQYESCEDAQMCLKYYEIERNYFPEYDRISDWEIRRSILFSYYNYTVVLVNARSEYHTIDEGYDEEYQERVLAEMDRALAVYDDPKVRAMDGDKYDLDGLKEELLYDVYGNWVCGCDTKQDMAPEMMRRADECLTLLYHKAEAEADSVYDIRDEIYCNYWKMRFFAGDINLVEYQEKIEDFCTHVIENSGFNENADEDFVDSRYFQINMYHYPNLACMVKANHGSSEQMEALKNKLLPQFVRFVEELPRSARVPFVNGVLQRTMVDLTRALGTGAIDTTFLLNIWINRDEATMIHAAIVKRLASTILEAVLDKKPELLLGTLGFESVVDVLENREKLVQYVTQAALLYDIGKSEYLDLIKLQSRRLEPEEREQIHNHAQRGYDILKLCGFDEGICEIALGHHKSYDGRTGYPESCDNTGSKVRFLTDLIRICDCMDAATDRIGRVYLRAKKLPEFIRELVYGRGFLYNPDLVDFIHENEQLQDNLAYICGAGRISLYYEAYNEFVDANNSLQDPDTLAQTLPIIGADEAPERKEDDSHLLEDMQELNRERRQIVDAIVRSSLFCARISINEDRVSVLHTADVPVWREIESGSFREFLAQMKNEIIHPDDRAKISRLLDYGAVSDSLYVTGGNFELEIRIRKEDDWSWVRLKFALAEEKGGIPQVVVVTATDIDATKKQELQIREALELAQRNADRANQAKSEFLSNMSHDIRTPMNVMIGMTQVAKKNLNEPQKVMDCLEKIEQASSHLLDLVNEVLDMSKIESGKVELEEKPISLREVMDNVVSLTQIAVDAKNITRTVDVEGLPDENVYGDALRIREILINLMSNAIKYTPQDQWIHVKAEKLDEKIGNYESYHFVVEDGGIGMKPEFLAHLFEPFAREEKVQTGHFQGTGLGLSITKNLVDMMQGRIDVTSEEGKGSRFDVVLRFKVAHEKRKDTVMVGQLRPEECKNRFVGRRILFAEDNELNRMLLIELLEETGVEIDVAFNGQVALQKVKQHPLDYYDMVFMDMQMPVMDGCEAAGAIRAYEAECGGSSHLPIIALTANVFAEDSDRVIRAGMDAHLGKPIELPKLLAMMVYWMEERDKE